MSGQDIDAGMLPSTAAGVWCKGGGASLLGDAEAAHLHQEAGT
jgi:hypothetical protein